MNQTIIVALGLPINTQGQFLLTKREADREDWHNKWQVTGGKLEFGEAISDGAIREIKEEVGLEPKIIYPYPIIKSNIWSDPSDPQHQTHVVLVTYLMRLLDSQAPFVFDATINEAAWFTFDEAMRLDVLLRVQEILVEAQQICSEQNLFDVLE